MSKHATVLIVEDEMISALFLKEILERHAYTVIGICSKGADAIQQAIHCKPDVIFMDIMLKDGVSGTDAALKISPHLASKIIFLTAYADEEMVEYALDAGVTHYLIKPYKEEQILTTLQMVLNLAKRTPKPKMLTSTYIILPCNYRYDIEAKKLLQNNREISLGTKSYRLVTYLCQNINRVIDAEALSYHIYEEAKQTSALRTLISRINSTLACKLIHNCSHAGYKIEGTYSHTEP